MATAATTAYAVLEPFTDGDGHLCSQFHEVCQTVESAKAWVGAESYVVMTLEEYTKRYYTMDGGLAPYDMATHTIIRAPRYVIVPKQVI